MANSMGRPTRHPRWLDGNDAALQRHRDVYHDHIVEGLKPPELSEKYRVSLTTIYKDIDRGRQLIALMHSEDLLEMLSEQIEIRRGHVRQLREQVRIIQDAQGNGEMQSPTALQTVARLHDGIAKHEAGIEGLLGMRHRILDPEGPGGAQAAASASAHVVIDMRSGATPKVVSGEVAEKQPAAFDSLMKLDQNALLEMAREVGEFDEGEPKETLANFLLAEHPGFVS